MLELEARHFENAGLLAEFDLDFLERLKIRFVLKAGVQNWKRQIFRI